LNELRLEGDSPVVVDATRFLETENVLKVETYGCALDVSASFLEGKA